MKSQQEILYVLRVHVHVNPATTLTRLHAPFSNQLSCANGFMHRLVCSHAGKDLHLHLDTIQTDDIQVVLAHTKPSARTLVEKYNAWQKEYESL